MKALIDWKLFRHDVKRHWKRQADFERSTGVSGSTCSRFWNGINSIPVAPFVLACRLMNIAPTTYLIIR